MAVLYGSVSNGFPLGCGHLRLTISNDSAAVTEIPMFIDVFIGSMTLTCGGML